MGSDEMRNGGQKGLERNMGDSERDTGRIVVEYREGKMKEEGERE